MALTPPRERSLSKPLFVAAVSDGILNRIFGKIQYIKKSILVSRKDILMWLMNIEVKLFEIVANFVHFFATFLVVPQRDHFD